MLSFHLNNYTDQFVKGSLSPSTLCRRLRAVVAAYDRLAKVFGADLLLLVTFYLYEMTYGAYFTVYVLSRCACVCVAAKV